MRVEQYFDLHANLYLEKPLKLSRHSMIFELLCLCHDYS